ncbi:glycosyltransferase family 2 protein [Bacillus sp. FJAT-45350]|uniref:glycosyltransferase family 2 protein n=1 Tax=Bacillus sp. FJAT-45350 TaxID=2011014 RepID=UPI0015C8615C|nr:glycosyltransferase family 2 protein [Bacillus sp. FJAT-45350]
MNPTVSIILTSYNKPNLIGKAIKSVLQQTFSNWELFIMDDNSNQETIEVITSCLNDPRIKYSNSYIEHEERHKTTRYATLINQAIERSRAKYVTYLTDDSMFFSERLQIMVSDLEANPHKQVVYSEQEIKRIDSTGHVLSSYTTRTKGILKQASNIVDHCSVMHTRKIAELVYKKYCSYWNDDPSYWHNGDAAFWARLNEFSPFYPIPTILDSSYKTPHSFQRLNKNIPDVIPNGVLVKGLEPDIYLIEKQKRRKVTPSVFKKLKYNRKKIIEIPDPVLYKYNESIEINKDVFKEMKSFPNMRLVKGKNSSDIYYIQNGEKRKFDNHEILSKFSFSMEDVITVSNEFISKFPEGSNITQITSESILPDGVIFKTKKSRKISYFYSEDNTLYPVSKNVVRRLMLDEKVANISGRELANFHIGERISWKLKKWSCFPNND